MSNCKRFRISGKVQGVYFRAATREEALRLGVQGWVRNLSDGDVEVLACGKSESLDAFATWLGQGPPRAQVKWVQEHPTASEQHETFVVRFD